MAKEYTTWNSTDKNANITLSNGDLTATAADTSWKSVRAIEGKSGGKWYWEITVNNTNCMIGIGTSDATLDSYIGVDVYGYGYYGPNGNKFHSGSANAYGDTYTQNDIIRIALDLDSGKIWFAKNGTWQASGNPTAGTNEAYSGISETFFSMLSLYGVSGAATANFGASAFSYSVPSGFNAGLYTGMDATYYISGYVKEGTIPVNRQIYLHNRDTGALITSTTSSGIGGYFYVETTYSGSHYVVCIDDAIGADYNDLIYGNIYPATISG